MWSEYENLTPEERMDRVAEILTRGVLRLIGKKNRKKDNPRIPIDKTTGEKSKSEDNIPSDILSEKA